MPIPSAQASTWRSAPRLVPLICRIAARTRRGTGHQAYPRRSKAARSSAMCLSDAARTRRRHRHRHRHRRMESVMVRAVRMPRQIAGRGGIARKPSHRLTRRCGSLPRAQSGGEPGRNLGDDQVGPFRRCPRQTNADQRPHRRQNKERALPTRGNARSSGSSSVGLTGFEPVASSLSGMRSNQLSYSPAALCGVCPAR